MKPALIFIITAISTTSALAQADLTWTTREPSSSLTFEEAEESAQLARIPLTSKGRRVVEIATVTGTSMRPAIPSHAVVMYEVITVEQIHANDNLVLINLKTGQRYCHPAHEKRGNGRWITKGINCVFADVQEVTKESLLGRVITVWYVDPKAPTNRG